jgi:hypothetical protein
MGQKFNPYHGAGGRFSSGQGADFASIRPSAGLTRYVATQTARQTAEATTNAEPVGREQIFTALSEPSRFSGRTAPEIANELSREQISLLAEVGPQAGLTRGSLHTTVRATETINRLDGNTNRANAAEAIQYVHSGGMGSVITAQQGMIDIAQRNLGRAEGELAQAKGPAKREWRSRVDGARHALEMAQRSLARTTAISDALESSLPKSVTKEYDAEAWDRRRQRREKEYEDELTAILEEVQARVIASVKREVNASGA